MASVSFLLLRRFKLYDHVERKMRIGEFIPRQLQRFSEIIEGQEYITILIPRAKTDKGRIHRLLPSFLLPHKHYPAEEVASVVCNDCGQCTSASESTIRRWLFWWHVNWMEFKSKGEEWERRNGKESNLGDATETTLAYILKKILPPFWLGTIMAEFSSEGLYAIFHRVGYIVHA